MSEGIEPHLRVHRTMRDAGIDHLEWERIKALRPIYKDILAAIGLTLSIAILYLLATVI